MNIFAQLTLLALIGSATLAFAGDNPAPSGSRRATRRSEAVVAEKSLPAREQPGGEFSVQLSYAQSAAAWSTVHDIKTAEGNFGALNEVLKREYGVPEEAFTRVALGYSAPLSHGSSDRLRFTVAAEGVGYGLVQNPVVPELHMNAEAAGLFGGGYSFLVTGGGPQLSLGAVGGMGREKRVDATSTDLIEAIPLRNGAIYIYGFDFSIEQRFSVDRDTAIALSGSARETLFETTTPQPSSSALEEEKNSILTHRWKALGELERSLDLAFLDRTSLALQGIAGPQPLPVDLLPRLWDYAHNLYPTPELGALAGVGLALRSSLSRATNLACHAGFYGGYFGGDLALRYRGVSLVLASFGLENSAAYHVLGERIWQAGLSFSL